MVKFTLVCKEEQGTEIQNPCCASSLQDNLCLVLIHSSEGKTTLVIHINNAPDKMIYSEG